MIIYVRTSRILAFTCELLILMHRHALGVASHSGLDTELYQHGKADDFLRRRKADIWTATDARARYQAEESDRSHTGVSKVRVILIGVHVQRAIIDR